MGAKGDQGATGPQGPTGPQGVAGNNAVASDPVSFTPVVSASGMVGTTAATGSYVQAGKLVNFWILVTLSKITTWGSGAFTLTLPPGLPAASYYLFLSGGLEDVKESHTLLIAGMVRPNSTLINMYGYTKDTSVPLTASTPIKMVPSNYFHISGSYITP
jgi:hypothetical protein